MTTSAATTALEPSTPAPTRTHRLEPDDVVVAVTTRHLFGLQRVRASVRLISGEVGLDANGALVGVRAELDAASFASGSRSRDRAVASTRLLDAGQHPRLVFASTSTSPTTDAGWRVEGTLTARGVPTAVTLLVDPLTAGDDTARATTRVDRYAHGITAGRGLASRHLDVEITVAVRPSVQH